MKRQIKNDLYRYIGSKCDNWFWRQRYIIFTPGFQYIYFMRHAQLASNMISRFYWAVLLKLCSFKFGIQIPYQTQIGPGLKIGHWGAIVINPEAKIGKNFSIAQGCLIGNAQGKKGGGANHW